MQLNATFKSTPQPISRSNLNTKFMATFNTMLFIITLPI